MMSARSGYLKIELWRRPNMLLRILHRPDDPPPEPPANPPTPPAPPPSDPPEAPTVDYDRIADMVKSEVAGAVQGLQGIITDAIKPLQGLVTPQDPPKNPPQDPPQDPPKPRQKSGGIRGFWW